jgi:hypothetical protein
VTLEADSAEMLKSVVSDGPVWMVLNACVGQEKEEPRNPINRFLAPQGLVRLLAGYQSRSKVLERMVVWLSLLHARSEAEPGSQV